MVLVQIWPFFQFSCLGNIAQENVFYDLLKRKNAFLGYKNKKFKKSKKKIEYFSTSFFLGSICQKNVFYDLLERKKAALGYKNKKFKKWKN